MDKLKKKAIVAIIPFACIVGAILTILGGNPSEKRDSIANGRFWVNKCSVIEKNLSRGWFSPRKNSLQCGEHVIYVNTADYDSAKRNWELTGEASQG